MEILYCEYLFVVEFSARKLLDELFTEAENQSCDETNDEFERNNTLPSYYDRKLFER